MGKEVSHFQSVAAERHASRRTEHTINSQDVTRYGNSIVIYRPQYYCKIILK